ncbi:MAG: helix-turn-helix transcriptional regulator [Pseudomonadales bacterium]|nr:helix-turn-helix transcriptional regulator [Pseudomonadales bacterium]
MLLTDIAILLAVSQLAIISLFSRTPVPSYVFPIYVMLVDLIFNLSVFRVSNRTLHILTEVHPTADQETTVHAAPQEHQHQQLMTRLVDMVEKQRLFSQHGLTISSLAEQLDVQEYRLRRLINKELKFKNFNQFLNNYRLAEASARLASESASISSIALDAGYVSLSSFNTAFKSRFGMTPSEYRARHREEDS